MAIPSTTQRLLDPRGNIDAEWRRWLEKLEKPQSVADLQAQVAELRARLDELGEGGVQIVGLYSVQASGDDGTYYLSLMNDQADTPATYMYGTDATGLRGWWPVEQAFIAALGELTKDVDPDTGVITFGLADVTPTAGGALQKTAFDAKGRRSQEDEATTDDLPEGATNLYYTDARADARIELQKGQPGGLATLDGSGKLDGGQLPALAITETFVVADGAAMLALDAQQGDVAVRSDEQKSYILTAEPASTLANWQELLVPTGVGVASFNGRTGSVVPATGDYTPAQVGAEPAISAGTAAQYWRGDKTWRDFATDARAAAIASAITDGDTTHAPSGDVVFEAIRFSGALVGLSGTQSITSGVNTTIPWGGETYDTDSYHNNAVNPSRLTVPASGYYIVSASVRYAPDPNGSRRAQLFKNGASFPGRTIDVQVPAVGQNSILNITSPAILCAAGDYFEVETVQDSGVSLNVAANDATWFAIRRIATD